MAAGDVAKAGFHTKPKKSMLSDFVRLVGLADVSFPKDAYGKNEGYPVTTNFPFVAPKGVADE